VLPSGWGSSYSLVASTIVFPLIQFYCITRLKGSDWIQLLFLDCFLLTRQISNADDVELLIVGEVQSLGLWLHTIRAGAFGEVVPNAERPDFTLTYTRPRGVPAWSSSTPVVALQTLE
jgi:hypothetical protein